MAQVNVIVMLDEAKQLGSDGLKAGSEKNYEQAFVLMQQSAQLCLQFLSSKFCDFLFERKLNLCFLLEQEIGEAEKLSARTLCQSMIEKANEMKRALNPAGKTKRRANKR